MIKILGIQNVPKKIVSVNVAKRHIPQAEIF
jgi:hypothetical protein